MEATDRTRKVRFDAFEVDMRSGEVRKHGIRLKLHRQPFQVLSLLLEHPGDLVTRDELRQKLWPGETFVDFDTGLNSAVKKLRDALCDSAEEPRYIETLPRRDTVSLLRWKMAICLQQLRRSSRWTLSLCGQIRMRRSLWRNGRQVQKSTSDQPGLRRHVYGLF